jgi:hypothetical protein
MPSETSVLHATALVRIERAAEMPCEFAGCGRKRERATVPWTAPSRDLYGTAHPVRRQPGNRSPRLPARIKSCPGVRGRAPRSLRAKRAGFLSLPYYRAIATQPILATEGKIEWQNRPEERAVSL